MRAIWYKLLMKTRDLLGIQSLSTHMHQVGDWVRQGNAEADNGNSAEMELLRDIYARQTKILELLEPQAHKLRTTRPTVTDWDEVQRQNVKQFEETQR